MSLDADGHDGHDGNISARLQKKLVLMAVDYFLFAIEGYVCLPSDFQRLCRTRFELSTTNRGGGSRNF